MLRYIPVLAMVAASVPLVGTATAANAQATSTCDALMQEWIRIEQNLAANMSDGVGDASAPRATLRTLEDLAGLSTAHLIYDMLKDNKCALPKLPPLARTYLSGALTCSTAQLQKREADLPECDRKGWKKE